MKMRLIKFRAWDKKEKKMIYNPDFVFPNYAMDKSASVFVLMQYIGLKDKNRKEVYEGDIVKYSWLPKDHPQHKTGIVVVEDIRNIPSILTRGWTFEIEVIGNVLENPDLLKGDKDETN